MEQGPVTSPSQKGPNSCPIKIRLDGAWKNGAMKEIPSEIGSPNSSTMANTQSSGGGGGDTSVSGINFARVGEHTTVKQILLLSGTFQKKRERIMFSLWTKLQPNAQVPG